MTEQNRVVTGEMRRWCGLGGLVAVCGLAFLWGPGHPAHFLARAQGASTSTVASQSSTAPPSCQPPRRMPSSGKIWSGGTPQGRQHEACLQQVMEFVAANSRQPAACAGLIPICTELEKGMDCCPRSCVDALKDEWRKRCPSGRCDGSPLSASLLVVVSGECVPGLKQVKLTESRAEAPAIAASGREAVVSNGAGVLRSTDDGLSWSPVGVGAEEVVFTGFAIGPGFIAGVSGGSVYLWAGSSWKRADKDRTPHGKGRRPEMADRIAIDSRGSLLAWSRSRGTIYRSNNRARAWMPVHMPVDRCKGQISRAPDGTFLYLCEHKLFRSRDGARNWEPVALGPELAYIDSAVPVSWRCFIADDGAHRLLVEDGRLHREPLRTLAQGKLADIWIRPIDYVQAKGRTYTLGHKEVLWAANDLTTWAPGGEASEVLRGLAVTGQGTLIAAGRAAVYRSIDAGVTWKIVAGKEPPTAAHR